MTSYERVMTALGGGKPDRVPVMVFNRDWTMNHLGFSTSDMMCNAERFVFAQYYCARSFGYDVVQDAHGINAESEAMGCRLSYTEDFRLKLEDNPIQDLERDLGRLEIADPHRNGRLPLLLAQTGRLKELSAGELVVNSYVQAPFRQAAMLRGNDIYRDIIRNRERLHKLLEIALANQVIYAAALVHAGADVIAVSDPTSSGDMVSPSQWIDTGHRYVKELVKHIKKTRAKVYLHICGDTNDRLDTFTTLDIDGISLDEKVDLERARRILGDKLCIIGNVGTTNMLVSDAEEIAEESRMCIEKAGRSGSFILCTGCGISKDCPPENIAALVKTAMEYHY
jgi:MtaA/CmuA family methyltransferase